MAKHPQLALSVSTSFIMRSISTAVRESSAFRRFALPLTTPRCLQASNRVPASVEPLQWKSHTVHTLLNRLSQTAGNSLGSCGTLHPFHAFYASDASNAHQATVRHFSTHAQPDDSCDESTTGKHDQKPIRMEDYSYKLNPEAIARYPAFPRGSSKLLECNQHGQVTYHPNFSESIVPLLQDKHVVFNESRVLDARLYVESMDNAQEEIECMILDLGTVNLAASCQNTPLTAMIRQEGVHVGDKFKEKTSGVEVQVTKVIGAWLEDEESNGNGTECLVRIQSPLMVEDFLAQNGNVPIPPYFHRQAEASDSEAYNNVYAQDGGSVAAPTAGLHFTDKVLEKIGKENCSYLCLHVGAGTFKPVLVEDARDHAMHAETFAVGVSEVQSILQALKSGKPLVVVGTTSMRTLESLYWCGAKRLTGQEIDCTRLYMGQFEWVPLKAKENPTREAALEALLQDAEEDGIISGATSLMITPNSYEIKMADHLITNFHAPDSTLMLLVSAFLGSGEKVRQVYEDAQANGYRFLSYGDSCFFTRPI